VRLAAVGFAATVGDPEFAAAGVEQHFEDLRLHVRLRVVVQRLAVGCADSDAHVALLSSQPFARYDLLVEWHFLVLQETYLVLHLNQLHLVQQMVSMVFR